MRYSSIDVLIFIGSFMILMNWGVRLTNAVLNYAVS